MKSSDPKNLAHILIPILILLGWTFMSVVMLFGPH